MTWLGLDIGGANIKVADGHGYARSVAFPLWQRPNELRLKLQDILKEAPSAASLAVTMTGELADCFATKAEGVHAICDAVDAASSARLVKIYLCDGQLVDSTTARNQPLLAAASNWHALAQFASRFVDSDSGLLIDLGSTTCDIIPLSQSGPQTQGRTDPERLLAGELVYTGVERSPLCAILKYARWREEDCPVAQEVFATSLDAYLMANLLPEDPQNCETADGRPRTKRFAHARLARSICADTTMFSLEDAAWLADAVYNAQVTKLLASAQRVVARMPRQPKTLLLSGQGEFLALDVAARLQLTGTIVSLTEHLSPAVSRSACAHGLAVLAAERVTA